jgi:hypothetical protein
VTRTHEKLEREVAALSDLPREELASLWVKAYGCQPPKGVKRALLERSAAWHLQAKRLGGLSTATRKALRDAEKRREAGAADGSDCAAKAPVAPQVLHPGTRLVREWNGRTHLVDVTDKGFVFDGKTYRSLTAIAKRITGVRWSGPRFFGL